VSSHELSLQQEVFAITSSLCVVDAEEQHEDTFSGLGPQQESDVSFSFLVVSMLLLQQEVFLATGTIGISFLEEQHDDGSFAVSSFAVPVLLLQQEVSLATGISGISFLEEQHDAVSVTASSFTGVSEELLLEEV
jgi:hypothetical protein